MIYQIYFFQVLMIACIGIFLGLFLGALIPILGLKIIAAFLPLGGDAAIFPLALLRGLIFGILTAAAFSILPLARTEQISVTALFRGYGDLNSRPAKLKYWLYAGGLFTLLIAFAIFSAFAPVLAAFFVAGSILTMALLWGVGLLTMHLARGIEFKKYIFWKMAISNLHRKGALTPHIVLSLGLGLTLLVTITLIDRTLTGQMVSRLPEKIPSFFFVGIQNTEKTAFDKRIQENTVAEYTQNNAPMLRGRIVSLKGIAAEDYEVAEGGEWVLRGDRGISFSEEKPKAATLTQGAWWPENYQGENLVSFKDEEARELGLKIGDEIVVNVLGRNISAKIANFRKQEWESFSINFVMVFSPNALKGAPYPWLSTLTFEAPATEEQEANILRSITAEFPSVTVVPVKQVMKEARGLIAQIAWGFRSASAITVVVAILVLAGALAAGHRHRLKEAVLLKTLGATRKRILLIFLAEYSLLGLLTAIFAIFAGSIISYSVTSQIMALDFTFDWGVAIVAGILSMLITIILGMFSNMRVLNSKPAQHLRGL